MPKRTPRSVFFPPRGALLRRRRDVRHISLIAVALLTSIIAVFLVLDFFIAGIDVNITNNAPAAVTDLTLSYRGGVEQAREIAPLATRRFPVKVRESDLKLEFSDITGKRHKHVVDVYLEHSYSGHIDIEIGSNYQIKWRGDFKLFWYIPGEPITIGGP